jgi:hypothetical protein
MAEDRPRDAQPSRSGLIVHVDGACHCGDIAFEGDVDPARVTICHCTDCQNLTGGAWRVTVPSTIEAFRLLRGEPRVYIKVGTSGAAREHGFCPRCGTPMFSRAAVGAKTIGLRVGTLRQRASLPPVRKIWCRSALAWSEDITALPGTSRE